MDRLAQSEIDRFIAEHGFERYPAGKRGTPKRPPRRCGDQPRKEGERYANGKLKWKSPAPDEGHEMTLLRRASIVGESNKRDQRAAYALGRLYLRGKLADPGVSGDDADKQAEVRHKAGEKFARHHFWLWGPGTAPSHMKNLMTGWTPPPPTGTDDMETVGVTYGLMVTTAQALGGFKLLEQVAIYDIDPADRAEEALLRRTLAAIAGERKSDLHHAIHGDLAGPPPITANDNEPPVQRRRRPARAGLPVSFHDTPRPDATAIRASVARLMGRSAAANDNDPIANDNEPASGEMAARA